MPLWLLWLMLLLLLLLLLYPMCIQILIIIDRIRYNKIKQITRNSTTLLNVIIASIKSYTVLAAAVLLFRMPLILSILCWFGFVTIAYSAEYCNNGLYSVWLLASTPPPNLCCSKPKSTKTQHNVITSLTIISILISSSQLTYSIYSIFQSPQSHVHTWIAFVYVYANKQSNQLLNAAFKDDNSGWCRCRLYIQHNKLTQWIFQYISMKHCFKMVAL